MAKTGRPKKYKTAVALRKAVDAYFASITYTRNVVVYRQEIREDPKTGDPELKLIPEELRDGNGNYVMETVWLEEPSKEALELYLGIYSRDTWAKYEKDDELGPETERAEAIIKARLVELLNTKNSVRGIEFNLKANYGWKDRVEVTHRGESVEDYLLRMKEDGQAED